MLHPILKKKNHKLESLNTKVKTEPKSKNLRGKQSYAYMYGFC